ncbi:MAG: TonB family protein [Bacteroidia bacterium]|nr:TonB family protein [Bacteroidia bacterium]
MDERSNVIIANLDEILFKNRNKEYGAYEIRKNYLRVQVLSFLLGTAILVSIIEIYSFSDYWLLEEVKEQQIKPYYYSREVTAELSEDREVVGSKRNIKRGLVEPPSLTIRLPKGTPKMPEVMFVIPKVVPHAEANPQVFVPEIKYLDTVKAEIGTRNVKGDPRALPTMGLLEEGVVFVPGSPDGVDSTPKVAISSPQPKEKTVTEEEPDPNKFIFLEVKPAPINLDVIKQRMVYPVLCKEAGIQGKVFIRMLVNKEGRVEKTIVQKSPHPLLTEECLRHIDSLRFTPGMQGGRPVKVWISIPFEFQLK